MGYSTKAIHTPFLKKDAHGSLHLPVYDSVSFEFESAEEIEEAFTGKKLRHAYTRITNPTVEHLEQKVKNVTGALSVIAVSSGMAAISNAIIGITEKGDNIITTRFIFGNTYSLFEKTLKAFGLETHYADLSNLNSVEKLIDSGTRAIFFETITNPQLEVIDIKKLSEVAAKNNILLIADSTVTPLYFLDAKGLGINIEVISATKYISGGATSVGGLIVDYGTYEWNNIPKLKEYVKQFGPYSFISKLRREVYRNLGACLAPHNAYLQALGMETLALRADKSCANAFALAEYLSKIGEVENVNYPGLESSRYYEVASRQFGKNTGALLTFELSSKEACFRFLNKLKLIRRATNINDNKSLAIHPSSTIFCEYTPELKTQMKVSDNMLRVSLGIEDIDNILNDVKQSLEA